MATQLQPTSTTTPSLLGVARTQAWPRCHRRLVIAAQHGFRGLPKPTAAPTGSTTRAEAYAASLSAATSSSSSSSTTSVAATATPPAATAGAPADQQQRSLVSSVMDPYKGGQTVGRPKPLRINMDLALYRARQTRIAATRSQDLTERSKLLRDAEAALRRCLELDPTDGRSYVSLGKILVLQRRYDEAARLYEEGAAATGGTNAYIWAAWAYMACKQGNTQLARKLYDAAVVADSGHAAAWHGWGLMEKGLGNYIKARDLWIKGIQATRRRPNPYLYQSLAVLAAEMGVTEEARKWFQLGTDTVMGAASHALWQAWALMEARQGDKQAVRPLLQRGLAVSPRSRYNYLALAQWEKQQGDLGEARRLFREGSERNPRDAALLQAWAMMEQEQGSIAEARQLFRKGSKADPSHLYVWQAWGVMEARAGNLDAARELFQQGVWSAPPRDRDVSLIFQAWAVLEAGAGNHSMARQLFKCAVKANPKSEPSWLAWADMEDSLGAYDRGNELRNFSQQERQEVVRPANFTTIPAAIASQNPLAQISNLIAKWFNISGEDAAALAPDEGVDPLAAFRSAGAAVTAAPSPGPLGAAVEAAPAVATQAVEGPSFDAAVAGAAPVVPAGAKVKGKARS
ncbi:hypothetical protein N2152v2_008834 [Parachlorella kessleri]